MSNKTINIGNSFVKKKLNNVNFNYNLTFN